MLDSGYASKSRALRLPIACLVVLGAAPLGALIACGGEAPMTSAAGDSPTEGRAESASTAVPVKIGVFRAGLWYLDGSGDRQWETTRDALVDYGPAQGATPFVESSIFDKFSLLGYYTADSLCRQHVLDSNGPDAGAAYCVPRDPNDGIPVRTAQCTATFLDGLWVASGWGCARPTFPKNPTIPGQSLPIFFGSVGDTPILGAWQGSAPALTSLGIDDNRIATFNAGNWRIDLNGDNRWDAGDVTYTFARPGLPVVGDWIGDGISRIGTFDNGTWYLDLNGNGVWEPGTDGQYAFGQAGDLPVVGYWPNSSKVVFHPPR